MYKFLRVFFAVVMIISFSSLALAQNEIRIGVIFPLTGPLATTGQGLLKGAELAAEVINNKYDLNMPLAKKGAGLPNLKGAKIKIVPGDHQGKPEVGMAEAERLITQEKVVAIMGCYNSAVTATASQAAERYGIPFLNDSSTSPGLTDRGFKWFFRTTPHDDMFSENFFIFLNDLKNTKKITIGPIALLYENTLFGADSRKYQEMYAKKYGYTINGAVPYPAKSTQLTSEIQKLRRYNPDIIMQTSYTADAILSMKTYKEVNFAPTALIANNAGFNDPDLIKSLGKDADYILSREVWAKDLSAKKPMIKTVADMFEKRAGKPMSGDYARSFTGMIVLADAINRAKSTEPAKIQQALLETDIKDKQLIMPWDGVRFDPRTHQNVKGKGIIVQIQKGERYTVWPFKLATKEVIWPFPKWESRK